MKYCFLNDESDELIPILHTKLQNLANSHHNNKPFTNNSGTTCQHETVITAPDTGLKLTVSVWWPYHRH